MAARPRSTPGRSEGGQPRGGKAPDDFLSPRDKEGAGPSTEQYVRSMQGGQANILVAVRLRPLTERESSAGAVEVIKVLDRKVVVVLDPFAVKRAEQQGTPTRSRERRYAFDYAFDERTTQHELYDHTARFLLDGIMDGFNATIFAYGATGAGKTFTMLGDMERPGIMSMSVNDLFGKIAARSSESQYTVQISYLEVYNENIRDLLNPSDEYLDLREDADKGIRVAGISEIQVESLEEVMSYVRIGSQHRTQEPTEANQESSRSHAVLQIVVSERARTADTSASVRVGKLSMIDLAGSERAANTSNRGDRMIEGANINRSLLALGNCINALAGRGRRRGKFVNYRDSKLTRLLKDSLGGNCRTVMIANISPSSISYEETHNTLKYANRAKDIRTNVSRNVLNVEYHIAQYTQIIAELRAEVAELKTALAAAGGAVPNAAAAAPAPVAVAAPVASVAAAERSPSLPSPSAEDDRQEVREMEKLRVELLASFRARMQIRKSLMEVEDNILRASIDINTQQLALTRWIQQNPGANLNQLPRDIELLRTQVLGSLTTQQRHTTAKTELLQQLRLNEEFSKRLRQELPLRVHNKERRELVELEYRSHVLEMENLELKQSTALQENIVKRKDLEIERLMLQLQLRDTLLSGTDPAQNPLAKLDRLLNPGTSGDSPTRDPPTSRMPEVATTSSTTATTTTTPAAEVPEREPARAYRPPPSTAAVDAGPSAGQAALLRYTLDKPATMSNNQPAPPVGAGPAHSTAPPRAMSPTAPTRPFGDNSPPGPAGAIRINVVAVPPQNVAASAARAPVQPQPPLGPPPQLSGGPRQSVGAVRGVPVVVAAAPPAVSPYGSGSEEYVDDEEPGEAEGDEEYSSSQSNFSMEDIRGGEVIPSEEYQAMMSQLKELKELSNRQRRRREFANAPPPSDYPKRAQTAPLGGSSASSVPVAINRAQTAPPSSRSARHAASSAPLSTSPPKAGSYSVSAARAALGGNAARQALPSLPANGAGAGPSVSPVKPVGGIVGAPIPIAPSKRSPARAPVSVTSARPTATAVAVNVSPTKRSTAAGSGEPLTERNRIDYVPVASSSTPAAAPGPLQRPPSRPAPPRPASGSTSRTTSSTGLRAGEDKSPVKERAANKPAWNASTTISRRRSAPGQQQQPPTGVSPVGVVPPLKRTPSGTGAQLMTGRSPPMSPPRLRAHNVDDGQHFAPLYVVKETAPNRRQSAPAPNHLAGDDSGDADDASGSSSGRGIIHAERDAAPASTRPVGSRAVPVAESSRRSSRSESAADAAGVPAHVPIFMMSGETSPTSPLGGWTPAGMSAGGARAGSLRSASPIESGRDIAA